jgi:Flp pilus assembly protein TadG
MSDRRTGERGNIGIWAALVFTAVAGFMALSVHAGRQYSNRVELQNGADAAALAAAAQLDGTSDGLVAAAQAATLFGAQHRTEDQAIAVAPGDVTFGTWNRAAGVFTPITGRTATDLRNIVAVQVRDARLDLPVAFGPAFLGAPSTTTVGSSAVAVGGGPCDEACAWPGALADCLLINPDGSLNCDDKFYVLNDDWQDNLGLTSLDPSKPASVPNIKAALNACVSSDAGTQLPVSNGNPVNSVFTPPPTFPKEVVSPVVHPDRCDPAQYQKCTKAGGVCANAKFVGDLPVVGYVSLILCYVTGSTVKTWPPTEWQAGGAIYAACGPAPTQADFPGVPPTQWPDPFLKQTIFLKHHCQWKEPGNGSRKAGCASFGTWMTRSRLVQ